MIGQSALLSRLSSYSLKDFPRAVLLCGEHGSGKTTLINEVANSLGIDVVDITETISDELLDEINVSQTMRGYILNLGDLDVRKQNILLKFIEEPPVNAIVFLECADLGAVLDTVSNRCIRFELKPYSKDELRSFGSEEALEYCATPGQMQELTPDILNDLKKLVTSMLDKDVISKASFVNVLNIGIKAKAMGYSVFERVLYHELKNMYIDKASDDAYYKRALAMLNDYSENLKKPNISKERATDFFAISLWKEARR